MEFSDGSPDDFRETLLITPKELQINPDELGRCETITSRWCHQFADDW